ncbi:MAG TPA: response regulator transcription factor [Planktothrix sp.]
MAPSLLASPSETMAKILVVEDEKELSDVIVEWLTEELHVVDTACDGNEAMSKLSSCNYDLIVLDLMLPHLTGFEVCRRYRAQNGVAPIIMLTAKKSLSSKEAGLDSGADDYLTKPFKLRELSARIRALLRRPPTVLPSMLTAGDIELDSTTRRVKKAGAEVRLLAKEFALLELLMRNAGQVMSVDHIIDSAWRDDRDVSPDTIRSYIRSLRKKLDCDSESSIIQNVHGVGYKIEVKC